MGLMEAIFESKVSDLALSESVVACERQTTLDEAIQLMVNNGIGSIVVVDNGRPVGIFTERDVLRQVAARDLDFSKAKIQDFMTLRPVCVGEDASFIKIMAAMRLGKFRHLVVTNSEGKVTGVISVKDVIDVMVDRFNEIDRV